MKRFGLIALVLSLLVIGVVIWLGLGPSYATSDQTQTSSPSLTKTGQPSSLQDKLAAAINQFIQLSIYSSLVTRSIQASLSLSAIFRRTALTKPTDPLLALALARLTLSLIAACVGTLMSRS